MAQQSAARSQDATWPPIPSGTSATWPEERVEAIIDELVHLVGPRPSATLCNHVRQVAATPGDLRSYRTLGQELLIEGAVQQAMGVFELVMREFPHHPLGPWKYAVCLRTIGDMVGAREYMERAWRRSVELPRSIDVAERGEFDRDAQLAGLSVH